MSFMKLEDILKIKLLAIFSLPPFEISIVSVLGFLRSSPSPSSSAQFCYAFSFPLRRLNNFKYFIVNVSESFFGHFQSVSEPQHLLYFSDCSPELQTYCWVFCHNSVIIVDTFSRLPLALCPHFS